MFPLGHLADWATINGMFICTIEEIMFKELCWLLTAIHMHLLIIDLFPSDHSSI